MLAINKTTKGKVWNNVVKSKRQSQGDRTPFSLRKVKNKVVAQV